MHFPVVFYVYICLRSPARSQLSCSRSCPNRQPAAQCHNTVPKKQIITEEDEVHIQQAKLDYKARRYPSIRQAAIANEVQYITLWCWILGLSYFDKHPRFKEDEHFCGMFECNCGQGGGRMGIFHMPLELFFQQLVKHPTSSFLMQYVLVTCYVLFETALRKIGL